MEGLSAPRRAIRSFVMRAGRIGPGQQRALAELGPRFVLPHQAQPLDLAQAFGRHAPCVLEIGFGMGDATAQIALAHPHIDYLGVEVHVAGVGALLKRIGEQGLTNVRIVQHDAVEVLRDMIGPGTLSALHIYFPDPWHKVRHHKRRLIQPPFVALAASRLASGGLLHCATDWEPYAQQMREVLGGEPLLRPASVHPSGPDGFWARPPWRPATKFEQRGLRLGHGVRDLLFERVPT